MALLTEDNRSASILAERQNTVRRDFGIAQHRQRDGTVIFSRFRIVQDRDHLLKVLRAQLERDLFHRGFRQIGQCLWLDLQDRPTVEIDSFDKLISQQTIISLILAEWKLLLIVEWRRWFSHGYSLLMEGPRICFSFSDWYDCI